MSINLRVTQLVLVILSAPQPEACNPHKFWHLSSSPSPSSSEPKRWFEFNGEDDVTFSVGFTERGMTRNQAERFCLSRGMKLGSIHTVNERKMLIREFRRNNLLLSNSDENKFWTTAVPSPSCYDPKFTWSDTQEDVDTFVMERILASQCSHEGLYCGVFFVGGDRISTLESKRCSERFGALCRSHEDDDDR